jgi:hypothetical protein
MANETAIGPDLVELVEAVVVHEKVDDERVDERLQSVINGSPHEGRSPLTWTGISNSISERIYCVSTEIRY